MVYILYNLFDVLQDLVSQSLMEAMCQIASGENPVPSPVMCSSPDGMDEATESAPTPSLATTGLSYLTESYARVAAEERNQPKVNFQDAVTL